MTGVLKLKPKRYDKTEPRVCETCSGSFKASKNSIKRGWGRFCSRSCQSKGTRKAHSNGPLAKITLVVLAPIWARKDITTEKIGASLGVSGSAISAHAKRLGLPRRGYDKTSMKKCSDKKFAVMWNAGMSLKEIAERAGYSCNQSVQQRRRMMGLEPRQSGGQKIRKITVSTIMEAAMIEGIKDAA